MCGRFSQSERIDRIAELFGAEADNDLPAGSYNVAPTDPIRIVLERDGARRMVAADWGFRPFWRGRTEKREPGWINARAETALESPAFGRALREQRCIIPADAFYEWDRSHRPPQPYAIGPADETGLLALAGVWTQTKHGELTTAAILTTAPNRVMARLHHRMPVIIDPDNMDAWLDPGAGMGEVLPFLASAPDDALRVWPVSTAVNKVGTNGPDLLRAVGGGSCLARPRVAMLSAPRPARSLPRGCAKRRHGQSRRSARRLAAELEQIQRELRDLFRPNTEPLTTSEPRRLTPLAIRLVTDDPAVGFLAPTRGCSRLE